MKEKILIVDGDTENRKILESILSARGYRTTGVKGHIPAIQVLRTKAFDLVITEAAFHEIGGRDLIKSFKQLDEHIEVIFISGSPRIDTVIQSMRGHGAFDFIPKPLPDISRLITAVEEALATRAAKKDKERILDQVQTGRSEKYQKNHPQTTWKKILIVDDDPAIQKMLSLLMKHYGYEVEIAANGFDAGLKIMKFRPGLILLDLFMPGMDGFEVCRRIKEDQATSHIKVVAITGYDTPENRERFMEAGADGYIPKPLDSKILIQHISTLLKSNDGIGTG